MRLDGCQGGVRIPYGRGREVDASRQRRVWKPPGRSSTSLCFSPNLDTCESALFPLVGQSPPWEFVNTVAKKCTFALICRGVLVEGREYMFANGNWGFLSDEAAHPVALGPLPPIVPSQASGSRKVHHQQNTPRPFHRLPFLVCSIFLRTRRTHQVSCTAKSADVGTYHLAHARLAYPILNKAPNWQRHPSFRVTSLFLQLLSR